VATLLRAPENPILRPRYEEEWEGYGAFNASVVYDGRIYHMVYRGQSSPIGHRGVEIRLSTIGYARSGDGVHFDDRRQLIVPEEDWEAFGCEDPRVTRLDGTHYVFYTALSGHPPDPATIKVGVAKTRDFRTIDEKHPVTTFNSKAMALFPGRVNGSLAAVLTVHTDMPPAVIAYAEFDDESQIWSADYWAEWYANLDRNAIPLLRSPVDQVEVGAAPVETEAGWLLLFANIAGYALAPEARVFGIEAALLDRDDPRRVLGRTFGPLLQPEAPYELRGFVPRVAFPLGALVRDEMLDVYYGAADTGVALARIGLESLIEELLANGEQVKAAGGGPPAAPASRVPATTHCSDRGLSWAGRPRRSSTPPLSTSTAASTSSTAP
jgi:predicted GH43/DUF377 family glycosyl hydrolase